MSKRTRTCPHLKNAFCRTSVVSDLRKLGEGLVCPDVVLRGTERSRGMMLSGTEPT